jgi:hypothetical protein
MSEQDRDGSRRKLRLSALAGFMALVSVAMSAYGQDQPTPAPKMNMVGFSTALVNSKAAFNQVLHYDPRTDMVEGSAAFVLKLGTRLFPIVEVSGEGMPGGLSTGHRMGKMK